MNDYSQTKKFPRPRCNLAMKMLLSYYASINKPQEKIEPIYSLIYFLSEVLSLLKSNNIDKNKNNMTKFLYFNKNTINSILFDNEEKITLNENSNTHVEQYSLSYLFYLSLLIRDNPDLVYYLFPIDFIININNMQETNNNRVYEKIMIAKIILELIENYRKKDGFIYENRNKELLKNIEEENVQIITGNLNVFRDIQLNLSSDDIKQKNIDELYFDIISSLMNSNKFHIYEYTENILNELDLESIDITKNIFINISSQLTRRNNYVNESMIKKVEDFSDSRKINFYYFLLKYIIKNSNYIYQIEYLKDSKINIINILKKDSTRIFNNRNELYKERIFTIINFLSDSKYYEIKYLRLDIQNNQNNLLIEEEEIPDYTELNEILQYYMNYFFESKIRDINNIQEIIRMKKGDFDEYLNDLEIAKNMNNRYDIINYIFNSKNKDAIKNEENFGQIVKLWNDLERAINDKKIKKLKAEDKRILHEYFNNENNKTSLLKIFSKDQYEFFLKTGFVNQNRNRNVYSNLIIENRINENIINRENINERYIIQNNENFIINNNENRFNQNENINNNQRYIIHNNENIIINNNEYIGNQNESIDNNSNINENINNNENNIDNENNIINENIPKLKEILKYYQNYFFQSKQDDINILENAIQNGRGEFNQEIYLKDYETAKIMNEKYDIINYLFELKYKDGKIPKTEEKLKEMVSKWESLEKQIRDKKIKKMRKEDKRVIFNYFTEPKNSDIINKIFNSETIEYFIKTIEEFNNNTKENIDGNDLNKLKEILKYYKGYLFESKIRDINNLEEIIRIKNGNYEQYLKDLETAQKMNDRYDIINYIYNSINKNITKTETNFQEIVSMFHDLEKSIKDKKIKKLRKVIKLIIFDYFNDENNKNSLLRIFAQDVYEYFIKESKSNKNINKGNKNSFNYDFNKLNEILNYYKNFLFESKNNEITRLENAFNNGVELNNINDYLNDFETAKKMNDRYDIINYLYENKMKDIVKTEKTFEKMVLTWSKFETFIKDRRIKKMRKDDKSILFKYFIDNKNKEKLLIIFNLDSYEYFIEEVILINKLKEVLNYYRQFLFESKTQEIQLLEEVIQSGQNQINYDDYLKDLDKAKILNERYELINILYESNYNEKEKNETNFNKLIDTWFEIEKVIKEKRLGNLKNININLLIGYFKDENNKKSILKIFTENDIEFFLQGINNNLYEENKEIIDNLKEVLNYYNNYLFLSKKDDIVRIEKIIENSGVGNNYEQYLNDLDIAKKMNERFDIINYIYQNNYKNIEKNEDNLKECIKKWESYERQIKDKKLKKMPKNDKELLGKYFNDEKNKDILLKIFGDEAYNNFKSYTKEKKEIKKNVDYSELKEVLNYYKEYLFESKKEEIKKIEEIIEKNEINYKDYLVDLDKAKNMNIKLGIIRAIYELKYKDEEKNENNLNECIKIFEELEKSIKEKKIKKFRKDIKEVLIKYFNDENNKEILLKIFKIEEIEYFKNETKIKDKKKNIEKKENKEDEVNKEDINKLKEILDYYKNYLFSSKKDDIIKIEKIIVNNEIGINYKEYLNDFDVAKKLNDRFNIIEYLLKEDNKSVEKNEVNLKEYIQKWEELERQIKNKKIKKTMGGHKSILRKYFNDENNKKILLKIFNEEEIEIFKKENIQKEKKKNLEEQKGSNLIEKNKENDKSKDLVLINEKPENIDKEKILGINKQNLVNSEKNENKENIHINENKGIKKNEEKKKNDQLKKIIEKKEVNENETINNIKDNKEKKEILNKLREILKYYKNFLFQSKKNDIILIENAIKEDDISKINYEDYLKILDIAKKMNNRADIIYYIFNSKNKNKNEELSEAKIINESEIFEILEKLIKDKKIKKIKGNYKNILYNYFINDNNIKNIQKIFEEDIITYFINEITKMKNLINILNYYINYLFESKKDEIASIKQFIELQETEINIEQYYKDLEIAKKMNDRLDIINYMFNKKYKDKEKNEEKFNNCAKMWEFFEDRINNKKLNNIYLSDKHIIYDFFNNPKNNVSQNIFKNESYEFFVNDYKGKKKKSLVMRNNI